MNVVNRFLQYITPKPPREQYISILKRKYGIKVELDSSIDEPPALPSCESMTEAERDAYRRLYDGEKPQLNNFIWLNILDSLRKASADSQFPSKEDVYIGEVPKASFNASYIPTGNNRYLILVHSGLKLFFFRTAVLFIGSCSFRFGNERVPPIFNEHGARSEFTNNLEQLFFDKHLYPLPLQSAPHIKTALALTDMLETFVVAHEIGHILKHNNEFASPKESEFSADSLGYSLYLKTLPKFVEHECGEHQDVIMRSLHLSGPHLFFHLATLLELFSPSDMKFEDTHPPAPDRSKRLWRSCRVDENMSQFAEQIGIAFNKITAPNRFVSR